MGNHCNVSATSSQKCCLVRESGRGSVAVLVVAACASRSENKQLRGYVKVIEVIFIGKS